MQGITTEKVSEEAITDSLSLPDKMEGSAPTTDKILTNELMEEAIDKQLQNLQDKAEETSSDVVVNDEDKKDAPSGPINAETALEILTQMSTNAKTILDDVSSDKNNILGMDTGLKRASVDQDCSSSSKRARHELEKSKAMKKQLQRLTRTEIEDIVATVIIDMIASKSELGQLRRKCDAYEELNEQWKRKTTALQKMCQDLNTVMRRFILDVQKGKERVAPVKITRSVGLQVVVGDRRNILSPSAKNQTIAAKRPGANNYHMQSQMKHIQKSPVPIQPKPVNPPAVQVPATTTIVAANQQPLTPVVLNGIPATLTPVPQASPNPNQNQNKIIDVVDLEDEDDAASANRDGTAPNPIQNGQTRIVPSNQIIHRNVTIISNGGGGGFTTLPMLMARPGGPPPSGLVATLALPQRSPQFMPARQVLVPATNIRPLIQSHPAPLPELLPSMQPQLLGRKLPPKPRLKISKVKSGIVLSWTMDNLSEQNVVATYQIFAYQETSGQVPNSALWKKVGDVNALPLPMACTLTQFTSGNKYHFAIRAQDGQGRVGLFSDPQALAIN